MKRALVVGCAEGVWDEVAKARALTTFDSYYVVKMAGIDWNDPGFFWWVTLHPAYNEDYSKQRAELGRHNNYQIIGPLLTELSPSHHKYRVDRRMTYKFPGVGLSGSSGLFGAKAALDDGHDKVVLAGVPMDPKAVHFRRGTPWHAGVHFHPAWQHAMVHLMGKVKSFSGWTEQQLGPPTAEWLNDA